MLVAYHALAGAATLPKVVFVKRVGPSLLLFVLCFVASSTNAQQAKAPKLDFKKQLKPFLKKYCHNCHSGDDAQAGLAFEQYTTAKSVTQHRKRWNKVLKMLRGGLMPPPKEAEVPPPKVVKPIVAWLDHQLNYVDCSRQHDPGRVTFRRLNRNEYNNTIRDLVGVDFKPAKDFPADDVGYGFDNIGDVLSLPTILMEKYLAAADQILDRAIVTGPRTGVKKRYFGRTLKGGNGIRRGRRLPSVGEVWAIHNVKSGGKFTIRILAYGEQAGPDKTRMELRINNRKIKVFTVAARRRRPGIFTHSMRLPAGKNRIAAKFINDYYKPKAKNPKLRGDRNLVVIGLSLQGPIRGPKEKLPNSHRRILVAKPNAGRTDVQAARLIVRKFARRAYRRPVAPQEVERLLTLFRFARKNGDKFEVAIKHTLKGVLISPNFLFRIELDPKPGDPSSIRTINEHELATRLAYFLWSSMPDYELFRAAEQGKLRANLDYHVRRMIRSKKSSEFVRNFSSQWLQTRNLYTISPDPKKFPTWGPKLREAMRTETEMFFSAVLKENRSIFDFIDADFTYLNGALAKHYGIPNVYGNRFQRVRLNDRRRGGVLTQASVLTVTADPTRTSPVKRGKWILEQILGKEPPPPPANVEQLKDDKKAQLTGTLRQRLEQHRAKPSCAVCHRQMDPLGFGFENYNAIGKWREREGKFKIDASGILPSGKKFNGPAQLKAILKQNDKAFRKSFAKKVLTYAAGRGMEYYDRCAVDQISLVLKANGDRFQDLILAVVKSDPFQKRRGKKTKP